MKTAKDNQFELYVILFLSQIRNDLKKHENNPYIIDFLHNISEMCVDITPEKFYLLEKRILKI